MLAFFFFFNDTATTEIYTLSLHDALPICVQTEVAERRTLNTVVRAPGTVQEDERRKSVVSLRFEGFIDSVENVTTGTHVHKGQRLMRIYGPNLSSAAPEYLSSLNARPNAAIS